MMDSRPTILMHEFCRFEVSHTRRNGNIPANLLQKYALGVEHYVTCIEGSPCSLSTDVISFHSV